MFWVVLKNLVTDLACDTQKLHSVGRLSTKLGTKSRAGVILSVAVMVFARFVKCCSVVTWDTWANFVVSLESVVDVGYLGLGVPCLKKEEYSLFLIRLEVDWHFWLCRCGQTGVALSFLLSIVFSKCEYVLYVRLDWISIWCTADVSAQVWSVFSVMYFKWCEWKLSFTLSYAGSMSNTAVNRQSMNKFSVFFNDLKAFVGCFHQTECAAGRLGLILLLLFALQFWNATKIFCFSVLDQLTL